MPQGGTYANGVTLSVDATLKQPTVLSRAATALTNKKLVSKRLFVRGPAVQGGVVEYERDQGLYLTRDPQTIAERAKWPRAGYSEDIRSARVNTYGLEFPMTYLAIRRNRQDVLRSGLVRLTNTLARKIDDVALALLLADADIQSFNGANWTAGATDIIADLLLAQEKIETQDLGYNGFEGATLVLNSKRRDDFLNNAAIRAALPRETTAGPITTGVVAPILGLKEIIFTPRIDETKALVMDTSVAGTVMDEVPDPNEVEGPPFRSFSADASVDVVYVRVYGEDSPPGKVVAAGRWPVFFLTDPKAVVRIDSIDA